MGTDWLPEGAGAGSPSSPSLLFFLSPLSPLSSFSSSFFILWIFSSIPHG